jgi:hypothetical protein
MTEILTKLIINCETGEETIVPLTAEEIAEREANAAAEEAARLVAEEEAAAKAAAKESALAKLAALGLTAEEATAIAGA